MPTLGAVRRDSAEVFDHLPVVTQMAVGAGEQQQQIFFSTVAQLVDLTRLNAEGVTGSNMDWLVLDDAVGGDDASVDGAFSLHDEVDFGPVIVEVRADFFARPEHGGMQSRFRSAAQMRDGDVDCGVGDGVSEFFLEILDAEMFFHGLFRGRGGLKEGRIASKNLL